MTPQDVSISSEQYFPSGTGEKTAVYGRPVHSRLLNERHTPPPLCPAACTAGRALRYWTAQGTACWENVCEPGAETLARLLLMSTHMDVYCKYRTATPNYGSRNTATHAGRVSTVPRLNDTPVDKRSRRSQKRYSLPVRTDLKIGAPSTSKTF